MLLSLGQRNKFLLHVERMLIIVRIVLYEKCVLTRMIYKAVFYPMLETESVVCSVFVKDIYYVVECKNVICVRLHCSGSLLYIALDYILLQMCHTLREGDTHVHVRIHQFQPAGL